MNVNVTCMNVIVTPIEKYPSAALLANTGFGTEHLRCHSRLEIQVQWRHPMMHRAVFFLSVLILVCAQAAVAQNHGEVAVFATYFGFHDANYVNRLGIGGGVSVTV